MIVRVSNQHTKESQSIEAVRNVDDVVATLNLSQLNFIGVGDYSKVKSVSAYPSSPFLNDQYEYSDVPGFSWSGRDAHWSANCRNHFDC